MAQFKLLLITVFLSSVAIAQTSYLDRLPIVRHSDLQFTYGDDSSEGARYIRSLFLNPRIENLLSTSETVKQFLRNDTTLRTSRINTEAFSTIIAGPKLSTLYGFSAGVSEGYNVGEHTASVINIFQLQKQFYGLATIAKPAAIGNLENLLRATLAFHDIGKGIAVYAGSTTLQHRYTVPIMRAYLSALGFNAAEIRLAVALVGHDDLGQTVQGRLTRADGVRRLQQHAQDSGLTVASFMKLQQLYYFCDAASYPGLLSRVFTGNTHSRIQFRNRTWQLFIDSVH